MGIIDRLLGSKTTVTSDAIREKIANAENEIIALREKIKAANVSTALLSDEAHIKVENEIAADRRAVARKEALIDGLNDELPAVVASEQTAAKAESDAALIKRANAARKANKDAAKMLAAYDEHASAIGDIIAQLQAMNTETDAVNEALRATPGLAETVAGWDHIHRTVAEQPATELRAMAPHWIYRDAPRHPGEVNPGETEEAVRATIGSDGKPIPLAGVRHGRGGNVLTPTLEQREVVTRTASRRATYMPSLDEARLPGAFAGQSYIWPRS